jgi:hypothetical protein
MPVIIAERDGEQTEAVRKARSNLTPSRTRRSMFGVRIVCSP